MTHTVALPNERSLLYSPVALELRDEFTAAEPIGAVGLKLEVQEQLADGSILWRPTGIAAYFSGGVYSYPGLGRTKDVLRPPQRFRIKIDADYYRPHYSKGSDGIEFLAYPYNDQFPLFLDLQNPANDQYARGPSEDSNFRTLWPNSRYPYPQQVKVIRGRVVHAGAPVVNAEVVLNDFSPLTDEQGGFALPVRFPPQDTKTTRTVEAGETVVPVEKETHGLSDGKIQIDGNTFEVIGTQSAGKELLIDPGATDRWDPGMPVKIQSLSVTVTPRILPAGVSPQSFQVNFDDAFSVSQTFELTIP